MDLLCKENLYSVIDLHNSALHLYRVVVRFIFIYYDSTYKIKIQLLLYQFSCAFGASILK